MRNHYIYWVWLIFVLFLTQTVSADTIAWWRFEEGSDGDVVTTIKDWGENGSSEGSLSGGSPEGDPVYVSTEHSLDVNGLPDQIALKMDGVDDYIPDIPFVSLDFTSTFTVECIIRWDGIMENPPEGRREISMILQQQDGLGTGRSLLYIQEDSLTLASYLGGAATVLEGVEVPANQWMYAGFTYDDGIITLWMDLDLTDGIDPASYTITNFLDYEDNDAPMIIGRHKNLIDNFHGQISELRITDSGINFDGPLPENPPEDHLQVSPAASAQNWFIY